MWCTGLVAPRHVGSSRTRAQTRVPCTGRWILIFLRFSWLRCAACGISVPRPGTEPMSLAVEAQSPNHWTTREVRIKFLYGHSLWCCKTITIVTSDITDHHNKYNNLKFEILRELPKCDTEAQSEQMLLEKWCRSTCSTQGCHKPSICKERDVCKA